MTDDLISRLDALEASLSERARAVSSMRDVEQVRIEGFGKKSELAGYQRELAQLPPDLKPVVGKRITQLRTRVDAILVAEEETFAARERAEALARDRVDVTLPGRGTLPGNAHPITLMTDRIVDVFVGMGYRVAEGPEVESDWYNFEALNMPQDHPARSMHDTMYVECTDKLLRTHTSPVQVRAMQAQDPPIYIIVPGRVFRRDPFDASHSPCFHQLEGLAVDEGITFADLKGTLSAFARAIFGPSQRVRLRPSYFPFTEPSAEVDLVCFLCEGTGCSACGRSGWIEILGAGMVHPNELRAVGYDPERVSGFAFGLGIERIAMLAYGIPDIRMLFENDQRFLAGFRA